MIMMTIIMMNNNDDLKNYDNDNFNDVYSDKNDTVVIKKKQ